MSLPKDSKLFLGESAKSNATEAELIVPAGSVAVSLKACFMQIHYLSTILHDYTI